MLRPSQTFSDPQSLAMYVAEVIAASREELTRLCKAVPKTERLNGTTPPFVQAEREPQQSPA